MFGMLVATYDQGRRHRQPFAIQCLLRRWNWRRCWALSMLFTDAGVTRNIRGLTCRLRRFGSLRLPPGHDLSGQCLLQTIVDRVTGVAPS
jgi:hypothetical protein